VTDEKSGYDILFAGLEGVTDQEEFEARTAKTLNDNVKLVLSYTRGETNKWVRTSQGMRGKLDAMSKSGYYDGVGRPGGIIPVFLSIEPRPIKSVALLQFGKDGPTRDSNEDLLVRELAENVFGAKAVADVILSSALMPWEKR